MRDEFYFKIQKNKRNYYKFKINIKTGIEGENNEINYNINLGVMKIMPHKRKFKVSGLGSFFNRFGKVDIRGKFDSNCIDYTIDGFIKRKILEKYLEQHLDDTILKTIYEIITRDDN